MTNTRNSEGVSREDRDGQRAVTVWMTGLSGAGKSTLASALEQSLRQAGHPCLLLDGDKVREGLNRDLGFGAADRMENMRRVAHVAKLANEAGLIVLVALISPLEEGRRLARQIIGEERFAEVYLSTSIEVCAARDPKGLYARARAGLIGEFTGVSSAYEPPTQPWLTVDAGRESVAQGVHRVHELLRERCFVSS